MAILRRQFLDLVQQDRLANAPKSKKNLRAPMLADDCPLQGGCRIGDDRITAGEFRRLGTSTGANGFLTGSMPIPIYNRLYLGFDIHHYISVDSIPAHKKLCGSMSTLTRTDPRSFGPAPSIARIYP